jgi:hypothetical protein
LGQRSRKRGRREKSLGASAVAVRPTLPRSEQLSRPEKVSRSEQRNAEVRATLKPFEPGERPWSIRIGAVLALLSGLANVALLVFGVKLKVAGTKPQTGGTLLFAIVMLVCAVGMWTMRYWAVLGFMVLLGITVAALFLALIKVSSILGLAVCLIGIGGGGFLFFKLVRSLSRLQMPKYPGR